MDFMVFEPPCSNTISALTSNLTVTTQKKKQDNVKKK